MTTMPNWRVEMNEMLGITPGEQGMSLGEGIGIAGSILSIFGSINSAIGSYYAAESQKIQLKMQAQNQKFASQIAAINARGAEFGAQQTLLTGARQYGMYGLQAAQRRSAMRAGLAARGGALGVGSAREAMASQMFVDEVDMLTINANRIRAAEAQRQQVQNFQIQSLMGGISAQNIMSTAGTISPGMASFTSALGSAGNLAQSWATNRRLEELLSAQSQARIGGKVQ
jgi:hypothetical protein